MPTAVRKRILKGWFVIRKSSFGEHRIVVLNIDEFSIMEIRDGWPTTDASSNSDGGLRIPAPALVEPASPQVAPQTVEESMAIAECNF